MNQVSTSERNVVAFYDTVAPVISVDASGEYAVLGGLRGLNIIDLESPFKPARILHHHSQQSGTTVVKWNPKLSHLHLIASTSNLNILIWNLERQSNALISTFQSHARSVSDIAWSPLDPNRLASCDTDGGVYIWDLRSSGGKPTHKFRSVVKGSAQTQWNRYSRDLLASTHDNQLEIWDMRGGLQGSNSNYSVKSIVAAHRQAIYGLDWSYKDGHELLTCSEDKSVKFWRDDVGKEISTLQMPTPVWKARYTPFGFGILTIAKRNDPVLRLWNLDNVVSGTAADLVQVYSGHEGSVRSFDWRYSSLHNRYQLISWGNDKKLRFFRIERHHIKECGHTDEGRQRHRRHKTMERPVERREKVVVDKYDPMFLKNDLDDYDNNIINGTTGVLEGSTLSVGIKETYGALIDINSGIGVDDVGGHRQQLNAEVEEWEEWSVAARSLEEEFDIIRRHLGGVMSGITGAVVSIDPQTSHRRCVVECGVHRDNTYASAIVAFNFPDNYVVVANQPYKGHPSIDLIDGSPERFINLHWDNIAKSLERLAQKRAVKGKRSLEILMRRLARSLARFVDGKTQDSSSFFQMEDVVGGGARNYSANRNRQGSGGIVGDSNPTKQSQTSNNTNAGSSRSISKLKRGNGGMTFSRGSLLIFGNNFNRANNAKKGFVVDNSVTIINASNLLRPSIKELAKEYKLILSGKLVDLRKLCIENSKLAKAHGNNVANEAWSLVASMIHPAIASPIAKHQVISKWQNHPLGQMMISTLIDRLVILNDIQSIAMISAVLRKTGLLTHSANTDCERIRHIYANLLYQWRLFKQRTLLLKFCSSGSVEAEEQICLESVVCSVCTLTCKGYVALCMFCGHGGHPHCYRQWHGEEIDCPSGCGCKCKLMIPDQVEQQYRKYNTRFAGNQVDPAINQQYCIPVGNVASREASSIRPDAKIINNELGQEAGVDIDIDDDDDDSSSEEEEEIEEVRQRSWRT